MARLVLAAAFFLDVGLGARCGPSEPDCNGPECDPQVGAGSMTGPDELAAPEDLPNCTEDRLPADGELDVVAAAEIEGGWRVVVLDLAGEPCVVDE